MQNSTFNRSQFSIGLPKTRAALRLKYLEHAPARIAKNIKVECAITANLARARFATCTEN